MDKYRLALRFLTWDGYVHPFDFPYAQEEPVRAMLRKRFERVYKKAPDGVRGGRFPIAEF